MRLNQYSNNIQELSLFSNLLFKSRNRDIRQVKLNKKNEENQKEKNKAKNLGKNNEEQN